MSLHMSRRALLTRERTRMATLHAHRSNWSCKKAGQDATPEPVLGLLLPTSRGGLRTSALSPRRRSLKGIDTFLYKPGSSIQYPTLNPTPEKKNNVQNLTLENNPSSTAYCPDMRVHNIFHPFYRPCDKHACRAQQHPRKKDQVPLPPRSAAPLPE